METALHSLIIAPANTGPQTVPLPTAPPPFAGCILRRRLPAADDHDGVPQDAHLGCFYQTFALITLKWI